MIFQQISIDQNSSFGYYLCDEQENVAVFIDPFFAPEKFIVIAEEMKAKVLFIILTHDSNNPSDGVVEAVKRTGAKLVGYSVKGRNSLKIKEGDVLELGNTTLEFIQTPGHSPDSICVLAGNNLLTGDTLFVGKIGYASTREEGKKLFKSLQKLMNIMSDDINVFPGYDRGVRPFSTIRHEKDNNPFLNTQDFKEFYFMIEFWKKKDEQQKKTEEAE